MRIAYAVLLILLIAASVLFNIRIRNEKGLSVPIRRSVFCSCIGMAACIVTAFSQSETVSVIAYGVYLSALIWLLTFFVHFILEFTYSKAWYIRYLVVALAVLATLNCTLNVFFHQAFYVKEMIWATNGSRFLILDPYFWYYVQTGFSLVMALIIVISLLVKTIETPVYYRPRYLIVLFMMAIVIILNMIFVNFDLPMDGSILFYLIFHVTAWYFSTRYVQTYLWTKTLSHIVGNMDSGLVIFDYTDECTYLNERAREMLQTETPGVKMLLEKWYETDKASDLVPCTRLIQFVRNGSRIFYSVQFNPIRDREDVYNGGFFVIRDVTETERKKEEEAYNSTHDRLTNLYNFDAFVEECEKRLKEDPIGRYVMIQTETEAFESVRDVYGTDMRNAVIAGMGSVIKKACEGKGIGGRMNGDSFGILLPEESFSEITMVDEIQQMMVEIIGENGRAFRLRVGVCPVTDRADGVRMLMDRAKGALSYLKEEDNASVSWYTDGMRKQAMANSMLSEALPKAIENGELKMYLQAQIDRNDQVIGAEALVRWHKDGKVLMPGTFLPLFEKNEQISAVDRTIWEQACRQLSIWKKAGKTHLFIAVNVARKDLYLMDICEVLMDLVKKYEIDPENLRVDFSCETLFTEGGRLAQTVNRLREYGFRTDLDEFGGRFTPPVLLRTVHFDGIKICRNLVNGIETDAVGKAVTKSMVDMAASLGIEVTAEGIETERELKSLKAMGCHGYQGFFISEPIPVQEFERSYLPGHISSEN